MNCQGLDPTIGSRIFVSLGVYTVECDPFVSESPPAPYPPAAWCARQLVSAFVRASLKGKAGRELNIDRKKN